MKKGMVILMSLPLVIAQAGEIRWRDLPPLPRALGGQFVGVIGDRLVVAGGSHWDGVPRPWDGGRKLWSDAIYTLERGASHWVRSGTLPVPLGYGAAASTGDAMLCIGGQTPSENARKAFRLQWSGNAVAVAEMPGLPSAASNTAGAIDDSMVYVVAGQATPASLVALGSFQVFSIAHPESGWRTLPAYPGPRRILPMAAAGGGVFYLIGGAELTGTAGPPVSRRFLKDVYRYRARNGWDRLPDLPSASSAGYAVMEGEDLLVIGGNDGEYADREFEMKDNHPGFPLHVYRLKAGAKSWESFGRLASSLVTSGLVRWGKEIVIAGGEDRPGHRSARVIAGKIVK